MPIKKLIFTSVFLTASIYLNPLMVNAATESKSTRKVTSDSSLYMPHYQVIKSSAPTAALAPVFNWAGEIRGKSRYDSISDQQISLKLFLRGEIKAVTQTQIIVERLIDRELESLRYAKIVNRSVQPLPQAKSFVEAELKKIIGEANSEQKNSIVKLLKILQLLDQKQIQAFWITIHTSDDMYMDSSSNSAGSTVSVLAVVEQTSADRMETGFVTFTGAP